MDEPGMKSDLRRAVAQFVRPEHFAEWYRTPNAAMGGKSPRDLVEMGRQDLIWAAIEQARNGEGS